MSWYSNGYWKPYVSVAERRRQAAKRVAKMNKRGQAVAPVEIEGRKIAKTFWGEAWCENLEAYSDYSNRLPRGRTYVRNGSVIHLQIEQGRVRALVSGSKIYEVDIDFKRLEKKKWKEIKGKTAGQIDSLVELLRGSISKGVMEVVTRKGQGLFPAPREIAFDCSCPDWATMCKHVAATLYGIGARLDHAPELLFILRGVDSMEMVEAAVGSPSGARKARKGRVLDSDDLSSVFGVDIDTGKASTSAKRPKRTSRSKTRSTSKARKKKAKARKKKAKARKKKAAGKSGSKTSQTEKSSASSSPRKRAAKKATAKKRASKKKTTRKGAAKKTTKAKRASKRPGKS